MDVLAGTLIYTIVFFIDLLFVFYGIHRYLKVRLHISQNFNISEQDRVRSLEHTVITKNRIEVDLPAAAFQSCEGPHSHREEARGEVCHRAESPG